MASAHEHDVSHHDNDECFDVDGMDRYRGVAWVVRVHGMAHGCSAQRQWRAATAKAKRMAQQAPAQHTAQRAHRIPPPSIGVMVPLTSRWRVELTVPMADTQPPSQTAQQLKNFAHFKPYTCTHNYTDMMMMLMARVILIIS